MPKDKPKHAGGRPTKYKAGFCDKMVEFYDQDIYETYDVPHYHTDGETVKWTEKKRVVRKLPTLVQFARHINIGVRTLYHWIDEKDGAYQKEFRHTYTHIAKALQKDFLVQAGLQGLYNPIAFKFVAVNYTDLRDKQEYEHGLSKETADLLGMIDGSSKGKLPDRKEGEDAG